MSRQQVVKTLAPDRHPLRRQSLREAPPEQAALEERDPSGVPRLHRPAGVDLIGGPAAIGAVRPMAVVEVHKIRTDRGEQGEMLTIA